MAQVISVLDICLFGAGLYILKKLLDSRIATPLPPGPAGWPVIGNPQDVPTEKTWLAFASLGRKYGEISSISLFGTRYVLLNSQKAVSQILEKQSAKSSDRPHMTMAGDLVGWGQGLLFLNYNDRLKQHRKHFSRLFGSRTTTSTFHPIVDVEARHFVSNVMRNPDELLAHIRTSAAAIVMKVIYGYSVKDTNDPFVELADEAMVNFSLVTAPGAFLVDLVPALRYLPEWFPGADFLRDAKQYRKLVNESLEKPLQFVTDQMRGERHGDRDEDVRFCEMET